MPSFRLAASAVKSSVMSWDMLVSALAPKWKVPAAAVEHRDFSVLQQLLGVLAKPFDYTADYPDYQTPPAPEACSYQTFCGT